MKSIVIVLTGLFLILQYKLWFERDGVMQVHHLRQAISTQTEENNQLAQRNAILAAEVHDLKSGKTAVEEHARNDLAMVKSGEVYYQIVEKK